MRKGDRILAKNFKSGRLTSRLRAFHCIQSGGKDPWCSPLLTFLLGRNTSQAFCWHTCTQRTLTLSVSCTHMLNNSISDYLVTPPTASSWHAHGKIRNAGCSLRQQNAAAKETRRKSTRILLLTGVWLGHSLVFLVGGGLFSMDKHPNMMSMHWRWRWNECELSP